MSFAEVLLDSYGERVRALEELYANLANQCEQHVSELYALIQSKGIRRADGDLFNIQFGRIDEQSNTHFRIVSATGVLVVVYDNPSGHVGAYLHYFNSEELLDHQRFYTYKKTDSGLVPIQIDSTAEIEVREDKIAQLLLAELLVPTVLPARIAPALIQEIKREGRIEQSTTH